MITSTKINIEYKSYTDIIKIKPIFDVHIGAVACDIRAFKAYLADSDENTYFFCGGDLYDSVVATDPRYRKSSDASDGDAIIDKQVNKGIELLEPYKDRIIAMGTGNHEDVVTKRCGTNMMQRTCDALGVPFVGFSGMFRVNLRKGSGGGRMVTFRYHHGWGGGSRTQGADLTKYSKDMQYYDADVFLYGHVHRRQVDYVPRLGLAGDNLIAKPKVMAICGTFLKTYTNTIDPTYSEIKGYPPVSVGGVVIEIRPQKHWVKIKANVED
jgi:hypothetical protein